MKTVLTLALWVLSSTAFFAPLAILLCFESTDSFPPLFWLVLAVGAAVGLGMFFRKGLKGPSGGVLRVGLYALICVGALAWLGLGKLAFDSHQSELRRRAMLH